MMDKQEELLRDILKEQKVTNWLLKRIEKQGGPVISQAEIDQFERFRETDKRNGEDEFTFEIKGPDAEDD